MRIEGDRHTPDVSDVRGGGGVRTLSQNVAVQNLIRTILVRMDTTTCLAKFSGMKLVVLDKPE
jgi:hypothetical protein